jgi:hypothetical protein
MFTGYVKTFGRMAITIEDENKKQYYAPFSDIDEYVLEQLIFPFPYLPVKFTVNKYKNAGYANNVPRYYAFDVQLDLEF